MSGLLPKFQISNMGSIQQLITSLEKLTGQELFYGIADNGSIGMPENKAAAPLFINGKEIQFLGKFSMISFLSFLKILQISLQFFLCFKGCSVST